jgi:hypothetical protein
MFTWVAENNALDDAKVCSELGGASSHNVIIRTRASER